MQGRAQNVIGAVNDVMRLPDDQRVRLAHDIHVLVRVVQRTQEMPHAVQPRACLVIGLDDRPRGVRRIGVKEHRFLGFGVIVPFGQRCLVDGTQLPAFEGVGFPAVKPALLFGLRDREPVFVHPDAGPHEHAFEFRRLAHEFQVFRGIAKSHDPFDACPIVPGPVQENHFARGRQMVDVALEIPLAAFLVRGFVQGNHPRCARIEVFGKAFDRSALARRIPALEEQHEFLPGLLTPDLPSSSACSFALSSS